MSTNTLDKLVACAGNWRGTNKLYDPNTSSPEDSPSTVTVIPILGGKFVRMDYTWGYQGQPQEGSFLIGYDSEAGKVTAHWIDTWHMGDKVMACQGAAGESGEMALLGSFTVPDSPDWGWRIVIRPNASEDKKLGIVMVNISPDGQEYPAVEAHYTKSASTMNTAIPVLLSLDVPATVRFYTDTLGFTCRYQDTGFAILQRDSIEIHFTQCDEQHLVDWSSCRVGVTGVDALYKEYSHVQRGIIHPNAKLHDTEYGTREFGMVDPQGVLITFFERKLN